MALNDCERLLLTTLRATSALSVLGGLLVVLSFVYIPKIRTHSYALMLGITISDSLMSVGFMWPVPEDRTWECRLQGWWLQFFPVTSAYLSLLTTVHVFLLIMRSKIHHLTKKNITKIATGLIMLSFVGSLMPYVTDQYGLLGVHCWIALDEDGRNGHIGFAMRWGLEYGAVWAICFICFLLYAKIFHYTNAIFTKNRKFTVTSSSNVNRDSNSSRVEEDPVMQVVLRLRWYPVIMFISWTGLILKRLFEFYSKDIPCWTWIVSLSMLNMQGFGNAIVFLSNNMVWQSWFHIFGWTVHESSTGLLSQSRIWLSNSTPTPLSHLIKDVSTSKSDKDVVRVSALSCTRGVGRVSNVLNSSSSNSSSSSSDDISAYDNDNDVIFDHNDVQVL